MKIYLAGPEVFLPDAAAIGQRKRELCHRYGFEGLYPLDNEAKAEDGASLSRAIFAGNVNMIREADALVANLTPFRGVSADVGTVFELGFAFALPKPVFGYSNIVAALQKRVPSFLKKNKTSLGADGRLYGSDNFAIENFGLYDNLMLVEALIACGHDVFLPDESVTDLWHDLRTFESCLRWLAAASAKKQNNSRSIVNSPGLLQS